MVGRVVYVVTNCFVVGEAAAQLERRRPVGRPGGYARCVGRSSVAGSVAGSNDGQDEDDVFR